MQKDIKFVIIYKSNHNFPLKFLLNPYPFCTRQIEYVDSYGPVIKNNRNRKYNN